MIELGELREGVLRDDVLPIYEKTLTLPHIDIVGVGTNLSCLSGILPDYDKLNQLCLYRDLLHAKFGKAIPYVSGGTSVTIPLLTDKVVPAGINHFRIGETLFFGNDLYHDTLLPDMEHDVLKLYAEIIELEEKPLIPEGRLGTNLEGDTPEFDRNDRGKTSVRAILDIGLLDVEHTRIFPDDNAISCCGACSDMLVVDLGENTTQYKTGDTIAFSMDYMGAVRLMNSRYIGKTGSSNDRRTGRPDNAVKNEREDKSRQENETLSPCPGLYTAGIRTGEEKSGYRPKAEIPPGIPASRQAAYSFPAN